jgi:hypothetical protein
MWCSLGLRVPGGSVRLFHCEDGQEVFERVASAAEPGGVDAAVISLNRSADFTTATTELWLPIERD